MIKAVIFDLDNTLCNTTKALAPSLSTCYRFLANHYSEIDEKKFIELQGKIFDKLTRKQKIPLYSSQALLWHEIFYRLKLKIKPDLIKELILLLDDELAKNVELFPNVETMLQQIKKMKLKTAILSNGSYVSKASRFEFLNLKEYIDVLVSSDLVRRDKPSHRAFSYVLKRLEVKPEEAIFVGDELEADIHGAQNFGMKAIYNEWNEQKLDPELAHIKPDYVVKKPDDVIELLKKLIK